MPYRQIDSWEKLPRSTATVLKEDGFLEFKKELPPDSKRLAKSIASFANALGGTLIVGVAESAGAPDYSADGLAPAYAEKLRHAFDMAARDFCVPAQSLYIEEIPIEPSREKVLLAVNVEPFPELPVGVRHATDEEPLWQFPMRSGRHTKYLPPELLPMLMDPRVRRLKIALLSIPEEARPRCQVYFIASSRDYLTSATQPERRYFAVESCWLRGVDRESDTVALQFSGETLNGTAGVPLVDVGAVWRTTEGRWALRVGGGFRWPRGADGEPLDGVEYYPRTIR